MTLGLISVGLAGLNVGLTVWHWRILRRARRYEANSLRLHDDAERLIAHARALVTGGPAIASNGHRPPVEDGAEP